MAHTVKFPLMDDNGYWDKQTHTSVELLPTDGTYPTDAIDCTQLSSKFAYSAATDETKNYWVVIDGELKYKLLGYYAEPAMGKYA